MLTYSLQHQKTVYGRHGKDGQNVAGVVVVEKRSRRETSNKREREVGRNARILMDLRVLPVVLHLAQVSILNLLQTL